MDEKHRHQVITMICGIMGIAFVAYWGSYCLYTPFSKSILQWSHPTGRISMSPKLILQMDFIQCVMIIIYIVMMLDFRANMCFLLLLGLAGAQLIQQVWAILHKDQFLRAQLSIAWQIAYEQNPGTLGQMETHYQCRGFYHSQDRAMTKESTFEGCYRVLEDRFGHMIYQWAILVLFIKCVQVICGLVCYLVYTRYSHSQKDDVEFLPVSKITTI